MCDIIFKQYHPWEWRWFFFLIYVYTFEDFFFYTRLQNAFNVYLHLFSDPIVIQSMKIRLLCCTLPCCYYANSDQQKTYRKSDNKHHE